MPKLLDLLRRERVPATMFTTGEVALRYPNVVERVVRDGHELACHGMTHRAFTSLSEAEARAEIEDSAAILRRFAPVDAFRAPYLKFPPAYVAMLRDAGFRLDSSHAKYKLAYYRDRTRAPIPRIAASVTSSVLRLPRLLRAAYLRPLRDPVVLFVHPWEFVDLRRERLRFDCRFRTGDTALRCLADTIDAFKARGARFVRMRELLDGGAPDPESG
jgi:peptidoglycan/xylan/chitin deacetylase (PgdA/CDA1 family)